MPVAARLAALLDDKPETRKAFPVSLGDSQPLVAGGNESGHRRVACIACPALFTGGGERLPLRSPLRTHELFPKVLTSFACQRLATRVGVLPELAVTVP